MAGWRGVVLHYAWQAAVLLTAWGARRAVLVYRRRRAVKAARQASGKQRLRLLLDPEKDHKPANPKWLEAAAQGLANGKLLQEASPLDTCPALQAFKVRVNKELRSGPWPSWQGSA